MRLRQVLVLAVILSGLCTVLYGRRPVGDINSDGAVEFWDLQNLSSNWLEETVECDLNGDGYVSCLDFNLMAGNWLVSRNLIVINEIMAANTTAHPDERGEYDDWIELYNPGDSPVDIGGMHLTDKSDNSELWQIPLGHSETTTIEPLGYLILWADKDIADGPLHINFKLDADGEQIALYDVDEETLIDAVEFDDQVTDVSFGSTTDGGDVWHTLGPTPNSTNNDSFLGLVSDTHFSHKRGFYTESFSVTVTCDTPDSSIHYTTDGSEPALTDALYSSPITITHTTCLRVRAFKPGWESSNIDSQTYIFIDDVITQSPLGQAPGSGWPTFSVNGQQINYGMDPDIVNSDEYRDLMDDALLAIPTISIITDLDNLYDPIIGIYVNAKQDGIDWERPASVELIRPDGEEGFNINAGLRIRGGFSRNDGNPKHAFRLFFRDQYGKSKLKFPLFETEGVDEFEKMDLRTAQNYSWSYQGDSRNTFVREVFSRDSQRDMGQPYTRSRYYHLYLNGQYWGLFQTQERSDARYAESYLGGDKDDYDVLKVEAGSYVVQATDGDDDAWERLWLAAVNGFETNQMYYQICGKNIDGSDNPNFENLLDPDNLIDYMLATYYVGDFDGPISNFLGNNRPNNFYGVYNRTNPDGFKFFRHDGEHTMLNLNQDRTGPYPAGDQLSYFNPQWLHQQLMENGQYRMKFADRAFMHYFRDGALTPSNAIERLQNRIDRIETAIIAESARWGDAKRTTPYDKTHWLNAISYLLNDYLPQRRDIVIQQFRQKDWYPQIDAIEFNQPGGEVVTNFQLTMTAPTGGVYYTLDGSDPRSEFGDIETVTTELITETTTTRALTPSVANGGDALYQIPANFKVTYVKSNIQVGNVETAITVLNTPAYQQNVITENVDTINYLNIGDNGHWDNDSEFPTTTFATDYDDFILAISTGIRIDATGQWTFGVHSDDGFILELTNGREDYVASFMNPRAPADTLTTFNISQAGTYKLNLIYFERGGGAVLELFAAQGGYSSFNDAFQLIGDTDNDGLPTVSDWTNPTFDDSTWTSGAGGVGYERGSGQYDNYFNIDVGAEMYEIHPSCFIRIPFTLTNPDKINKLTLKMRYDDGFIAYLNGVEVTRENFSGAPAWNSGASGIHDDNAAVVYQNINISAHVDRLIAGQNILAVHALNYGSDSTDLLISPLLDAAEVTTNPPSDTAIEYIDPVAVTHSMQVKARAYDGYEWSALNEAAFSAGPVKDSLRITEIMYHPPDPNAEFIELQNIGVETVNLNMVSFTNGISYTFDSKELAAGEYILLVRNATVFESVYGNDLNPAGEFLGKLDNGGETIQLVDAIGQTILNFKYEDYWYPNTDGPGYSLTVREPATTDPANWGQQTAWTSSSNLGGTPGEAATSPKRLLQIRASDQ